MWLMALRKIYHFAGQRRVDQNGAGDPGHDVHIKYIELARTGHPVEQIIEDEQPTRPSQKIGNRIADQPDDADHMVGPFLVPIGRGNTHRHAEDDAEQEANRRQFERRGKDADEVGEHRPRRRKTTFKIAAQQLADIFEELLPDRLVEPELEIDALIDFRCRLLADVDSTGSIGSTRPMKKVSAARPSRVIATVSSQEPMQ